MEEKTADVAELQREESVCVNIGVVCYWGLVEMGPAQPVPQVVFWTVFLFLRAVTLSPSTSF